MRASRYCLGKTVDHAVTGAACQVQWVRRRWNAPGTRTVDLSDARRGTANRTVAARSGLQIPGWARRDHCPAGLVSWHAACIGYAGANGAGRGGKDVKKLLLLGSAIAAGVLIKRLLESSVDARPAQTARLLGSGMAGSVFGIVRAADEDEALALIARFDEHQIDCALLALERDLDGASLGLAERLRKEHGDHLDETRARREERGSEDEVYGAVEAFDVHCRDRLADLREIDDDEFAERYVDRVAAEHEAMIEAIDEALLPATDDATVRELLQRHRQHMVTHLANARLLH